MAEEQKLGEQELNAILDRLIEGKAPEESLGRTVLGLRPDERRSIVG